MAFERIGLGGILTFDGNQAVVSMGQSAQALGALNSKAEATPGLWQRMGASIQGALDSAKGKLSMASRGASQLGSALTAGAMAAAPITYGLSKAFQTANDFEKQMAATFSVINADGTVAGDTLVKLRGFAQEMGAASVFSSTESAQAMEAMARNGMNADAIMQGLGAVMNAAAADGLGLEESANIVSAALNQFELDASDATKVADLLAAAGASTATDIRQMGEALKYAAPSAHALGMDIYETSGALAAISNSGIGASMAGTHFTQMMNHMVKQTPKGTKVLKELGVSMKKANGDLRPLVELIPELDAALKAKFPGTADRAKAIEELFATEGALGFDTLVASVNNKDEKKNLASIIAAQRASEGTALRQATTRMDTFSGRVTQFMGGVESMSIEVMGAVGNNMKGVVDTLSNGLGRVVSAFMMIKSGDIGGSFIKNGKTATQVARGLRDAINFVNAGWDMLVDRVRTVASTIGVEIGGLGVRELTRMAAILVFVVGAGAPLIGLFAAVAFIITSVLVPALAGAATLAAAVFSPMGAALVVLSFILFEVREQFADFFTGIFEAVQVVAPDMLEAFQGVFDAIKFSITELSMWWHDGVEGMTTDWKGSATTIISVLAAVIETIATVVKWAIILGTALFKIVDALAWVWIAFNPLGIIIGYFIGFKRLLVNIGTAVVEMFEGNFVRGLLRIMTAIIDFLLSPLIMVAKAILKLGALSGVGMPAWLSTFANEGFTGIAMGEMDKTAEQKQREENERNRPQDDASESMSIMADTQNQSMAPAVVNVSVEDKKPVNVNVKSTVEMDKRALARGMASHQQDMTERAGATTQPWQRRRFLETGAKSGG